MPKTLPPPPGKCVHCLKDPVERTWDHVFPRSWYPDTTPLENSKWKIPACRPCNDAYGKLEENLLLHLGLCVNWKTAEASGIAQKALRALDPNQTDSQEEARHRQNKRDKILSKVIPKSKSNKATLLSGFEGLSNQGETVLVPIPEGIPRLTEKIVRGLAYLNSGGQFIEEPYKIRPMLLQTKEAWDEFTSLLIKEGNVYENGPGIKVWGGGQTNPETNNILWLVSIEIWGQLRMCASIEVPEDYPE